MICPDLHETWNKGQIRISHPKITLDFIILCTLKAKTMSNLYIRGAIGKLASSMDSR